MGELLGADSLGPASPTTANTGYSRNGFNILKAHSHGTLQRSGVDCEICLNNNNNNNN